MKRGALIEHKEVKEHSLNATDARFISLRFSSFHHFVQTRPASACSSPAGSASAASSSPCKRCTLHGFGFWGLGFRAVGLGFWTSGFEGFSFRV